MLGRARKAASSGWGRSGRSRSCDEGVPTFGRQDERRAIRENVASRLRRVLEDEGARAHPARGRCLVQQLSASRLEPQLQPVVLALRVDGHEMPPASASYPYNIRTVADMGRLSRRSPPIRDPGVAHDGGPLLLGAGEGLELGGGDVGARVAGVRGRPDRRGGLDLVSHHSSPLIAVSRDEVTSATIAIMIPRNHLSSALGLTWQPL